MRLEDDDGDGCFDEASLAAMSKADLLLEMRKLSQGFQKYRKEVSFQKDLLASVGQAIICTDLTGQVTYWNAAATLIYGWQEQEALGKSIMELTPADTTVQQATEIFTALSRGEVWNGEFLVRRRDGSAFHAMVTDTPILDKERKLIGIIGVSADISELKRKEQEIRGLNEDLELRVEERTRQLELSNEALRVEIEGHLKAQQHLQQCIRDLEESRDKIAEQSLALEQLVEDLKEARQEAESANQLKSRFLASMSHEIRTPMNGVLGMTNLLLSTPLSEEQKQFVDTIRTSGDALLTIINDILDLSKIEAGELELEHRSFELCACVEDAVHLLAVTALEKQIELVTYVDPLAPKVITSDSTRLRQVLVNLVSNAIKFTEKGEVEISVTSEPWHGEGALASSSVTDMAVLMGMAVGGGGGGVGSGGEPMLQHANEQARAGRALTVSEREQGEWPKQQWFKVLVSVRDTGIGIVPELMDRLFKPFSQLDVSTTRKYGGTGLGLVISRQLVEMLGGRIWAESRGEGTGSVFNFFILVPGFGEGCGGPLVEQRKFSGGDLEVTISSTGQGEGEHGPLARFESSVTADKTTAAQDHRGLVFDKLTRTSSVASAGISEVSELPRTSGIPTLQVARLALVASAEDSLQHEAPTRTSPSTASPLVASLAQEASADSTEEARAASAVMPEAGLGAMDREPMGDAAGSHALAAGSEPAPAPLVRKRSLKRRQRSGDTERERRSKSVDIQRSQAAEAERLHTAEKLPSLRRSCHRQPNGAVFGQAPLRETRDICALHRPCCCSCHRCCASSACCCASPYNMQGMSSVTAHAAGEGGIVESSSMASAGTPRSHLAMGGTPWDPSPLPGGAQEAGRLLEMTAKATDPKPGTGMVPGPDTLRSSEGNKVVAKRPKASMKNPIPSTRTAMGPNWSQELPRVSSHLGVPKGRLVDAEMGGKVAAAWGEARRCCMGLRAVVASSHAATRGMVSRHLQALGMEVQLANSLEEAEKALQSPLAPLTVDLGPSADECMLVEKSQGHLGRNVEGQRCKSAELLVLGNELLWPQPPPWLTEAMAFVPKKIIYTVPVGSNFKAPDCPGSHSGVLMKPVRQTHLNRLLYELLKLQGCSTASATTTVPSKTVTVAAGPPIESHASLATSCPLSILLVEDNAVNQVVASKMLGRMGYKCQLANNGMEAIEALSKSMFQLVLMDLQMPVMDGVTATRQIREKWPREQQPKIFALTANVLESDRVMCMGAGMDGFISKPLQAKDLVRAIKSSCEVGSC